MRPPAPGPKPSRPLAEPSLWNANARPDSRRLAGFHRPVRTAALLGATIVAVFVVVGAFPAHGPAGLGAPGHSTGPVPAATQTPGTVSQGCDGMYWSQGIAGWYEPYWCYGHDEPTISYVSNAPHSGEDASFQFIVPSDSPVMPQGNLYATFWFGGVVADANSTAGGGAAFLELQFYPASPAFVGPGSGHQDCLPNGAFNYVWTPGANNWFVCAIVWQLTGNSASPAENAAIATPLDLSGGEDQIFEIQSGDHVFVNYSGVARTTPWNLHVTDLTRGLSGTVVLQNGTLVLSPYYTTAAASNMLGWSASGAGAIAFAYEVGHSLNPAVITNPVNGGCTPGDLNCYSYWPGRWSESGQMQLALPVLGTSADATYPDSIGFSSSQGGETEVNQSACLQPSFSTLRNCMYPFFVYRAATYGFSMDADLLVSNITHDFGNEYEFPGDISTPAAALSSDPHHTVAAPWGSVKVYVNPATATVQVNPAGAVDPVPGSGGVASGQFMEGAYWVNVSAPGCSAFSRAVYVGTGAQIQLPVVLNCGSEAALAVATTPASGDAPLAVSFLGAANGGVAPYTFSWAFGDGSFATGSAVSHTFGSAGTYSVSLSALDALGHPATSAVSVYVLPPPPELATPQAVNLYAHNVSALASGGIQTFPLSTAFPTGEPDFNSFYVVPVAGPSSWTFSLPDPTAAPIFLGTTGSIVAHFFVSLPTLNSSTAGAGVPLVVAASLSAGVFVGNGSETQLLSPSGATVEYNISFPPDVGTIAAGSPLVLTVSWYELSVGGQRLGWPIALHSGAADPIGVSLPMLDPIYLTTPAVATSGSSVSVTVGAVSPFSSNDLARVGATVDGAPAGSPSIQGTNYTWSFSPTNTGSGLHTMVISAYDVQGAYNFAVTQFQIGPRTYTVSFTESGLPSGTAWEATLAGTTFGYSSTSLIAFTEPNGSYAFSVGGETGFFSFPSSGTVTVSGANVGVRITFAPLAQGVTVTFTERGLARGTGWAVDLSGEIVTSSTNSLAFTVPASSTYAFSVGSVAGYASTPSSGSVVVGTAPVTVAIAFHHLSAHGPHGTSGTSSATPSPSVRTFSAGPAPSESQLVAPSMPSSQGRRG